MEKSIAIKWAIGLVSLIREDQLQAVVDTCSKVERPGGQYALMEEVAKVCLKLDVSCDLEVGIDLQVGPKGVGGLLVLSKNAKPEGPGCRGLLVGNL